MPRQKREVEPKRKKRYLKPEAVRVPLIPDEAVLGGCKTASVTGPAAGDCGVFTAPCSDTSLS